VIKALVATGSQSFAIGLAPGTMAAQVPGDRMEYEQLYREHRPQVLRICRLLLADPHEADDVAQEVLLKLLNELRASGNTISWRPWLNRVTVNACRDRRRSGWWKWWRSQATEFEENEFAHRDPDPEHMALAEETRRTIWEALRRLPARQREVFALRYLEGCSTEETAEALGLSTGSVKTHLFRAVHQMRATLRGAS
jgi:RNA polymerase sigma-70 factor, ECF subfamily